jgi:hypothetical protein
MDELIFAGNKYISSKRASKLTGYTTDYIGQMCRGDKMDCRLVGRNWYINDKAIREQKKSFKKDQADNVEEINYKKIELEPMYYSNDERETSPEINKTFKEEQEEVVTEEDKDEIIPIKVVEQPEVAIKTYQHKPVMRRVKRQVVRRQPIVPQQVNRKFLSKGVVAVSILLLGTLFVAGTLMLEQVVHYTSSEKDMLITELQIVSDVDILGIARISNLLK